MDFCDRFCLQNQISEPTEKTMTLLDVTLASLHMGLSDHDLVYAVGKNKLPRAKARVTEYKSMRQFDVENF